MPCCHLTCIASLKEAAREELEFLTHVILNGVHRLSLSPDCKDDSIGVARTAEAAESVFVIVCFR